MGQFEMNCTGHIHRCSFSCLQEHLQIKWIMMHIKITTITTIVSVFRTVKIVITFELKIEIIIHMIIKPDESGQGLGVVVFVILQHTTTDKLHH